MRSTIPTIIGLALSAVLGCAGQRVTTDYSPAAQFSTYRTYALVMPPDTGAAAARPAGQQRSAGAAG